MIRVYTKKRHVEKIKKFLNSVGLENEIFTISNQPSNNEFDLGVSYCYTRKIEEPLLSTPKKGFVNYHPGPLPGYKGPSQYNKAIKEKEIHWGVTAHYMNKEYDTGPIIKKYSFDLHEKPTDMPELAAITHYFLFQFFKDTIEEIYNK